MDSFRTLQGTTAEQALRKALTEEAGEKKDEVVVSLALAKHCRPFEDGFFFKELCTDFLKCFGKKAEEFVKIVESVPLSRPTIVRRTEEISKHLSLCVINRLKDCLYYSICLDESTDIHNINQLIIYVKTVNENLETHENFLCLVSLHGHVNGQILWEAVNANVFGHADKNKLSAVCTDGASVMTGKNIGLAGLLKKNNIDVLCFHCIIHQHALFAKELNVSSVMKTALQIINKIKGGHNALTHRKFKSFLEQVEADYGDLVLFTEVRWLSRGASLERLFYLREEVIEFLKLSQIADCQNLVEQFSNKTFLTKLAFLCDISIIINELNLLLQGKNKHIFELVPIVQHFGRKLSILQLHLRNNNFTFMPKTAILLSECPNPTIINEFISTIDNLIASFNNRFQDFKLVDHLIDLHNNTAACDAEKQNNEIKLELEKMLTDFNLPFSTGLEFWKSIDKATYPNIKNAISKLYSMFGATYTCESAFSAMKLIKTKLRNKVSDSHLEHLMRIKCFDEEINVNDIVSNI